MLSCHEATRLVSEAQERPLELRERLSLQLHLAMCSACRRFETQASTLRAAMRRWAGGDLPPGVNDADDR